MRTRRPMLAVSIAILLIAATAFAQTTTTLTGCLAKADDGSFTLTESRPEGETEHHGQYLEITRPRRLVFTFSSLRHAVDVDPVMVEITPAPEGGCDLVLVHEMQGRWADYRDRTRQGWAAILEGLGRHLA